jgi:transposase
MFDRHDLTDAEWKRLESLLPDRTPRRGGRWIDHRPVVNGVLWRTRTGAPWRDVPAFYGNWKTVYSRHRRWSGDGTWEEILDRLRAGCDQDQGSEWTVGIDSTVVRAHQHAAGARHEPPQDIPAARLAPWLPEPVVQPSVAPGQVAEPPVDPDPDAELGLVAQGSVVAVPAGVTGGWVE